ncbi:MAG: ABC transporter substrate-binding protein, partial [Oscillospiraceae bacterium]|nr:ABC transporter substrate-binding protein [Oscillospiraceae bacterium]
MKKLICILLAAGMVLSAFTACGKEEQLTKITLSEVTHSIFYAPQYVAINEGYFAEEGLEIELVNAGGADKVMTSVLTGAADIGFAGAESCIYVYLQGKEEYPKVFAQLTECDGSFLVGREDVADFDWQSLKGSTILPGRKGGMPYMTLLYALEKNGLEVGKDVFFNDTVQFDAMTGAFVAGEGDYVTVFEPSATALEAEGKGYVLASVGEEGGRVPYTTYFAMPDADGDMLQRFTNAIAKGQRFVAEKSAAEIAQAIAPSFADTDLETIEKVVQ